MSLGDIVGRIVLDASGVRRGVDEARSRMDTLNVSSADIGKGFGAIGLAAGAAGGAIAVGLGNAVNTAKDFEFQLSAIGAVSGATGEQMDSIREKAMQLGADSAYSASEAALAMEELAKAGIPIPDILNGAADAAVALAAAGGISLPEAATLAADAMSMFSLAAEDLEHVTDLYAGAANASSIGVSDLGASMKYVGPVAKTMGVSIDDATKAIALLGKNGIKGSQAGTALRSILTNLTPSTKKAQNAMKELGLWTEKGGSKFVDASGKVKPFGQVVDTLRESMKGLTATEQAQKLKDMFGTEALSAAAAIAGTSAEKYNELATAIDKTKASDVASKRQDNYASSLEQLGGSLDTLKIQIGSALIPFLNKAAKAITGLINKFTEAPGPVKVFAAIFLAVLAGVLLLVAGLVTLVVVVGGFLAAIAPIAAIIGVTVAALTGWLIAIPLIIAAVVALGVVIFQNWDKIKQWTGQAWEWVKAKSIAVWNAIWAFLDSVGQSINNTIYGWINAAGAFISAGWAKVKSITSSAWNAVKSFLSAVLSGIMSGIRSYFNFYRTIITTVWRAIRTLTSAAWNGIRSAVTSALSAVGSVISSGMSRARSIISSAWNAARSITRSAWNAIRSTVQSVVSAIGSAVRSGMSRVVSAVRSGMSNAMSAARSFVGRAAGIGRDIINGIANGVRNAAGNIASAAANAVKNAISAAKRAVGISSPSKMARDEVGEPIGQGFGVGISNEASTVRSAAVGAVTSAIDAAKRLAARTDLGEFAVSNARTAEATTAFGRSAAGLGVPNQRGAGTAATYRAADGTEVSREVYELQQLRAEVKAHHDKLVSTVSGTVNTMKVLKRQGAI